MVNIDKITNTIAQPDVWLCHRNYDKICLLSPIADLKIYVAANAVDEVSFTLHKYNNGVEFPYWDKIKDLKVVCVDGFGYFEIAVDKNVADDTKKVITGVSIEAELGQITVDGLEINGEVDRNNKNNWDDSGAYIKTVIYNSSDTSHSLLHRLMSYAPHWKLGDIKNTCPTITTTTGEESVSEAKRTFSFDGTNVYDALQEIATELDVVFVFNTVERSVSMYDLNKIGEDTTIYVSTENLATDFTCTSNKDSIKNCFKILGGDDKTNNAVRTVNPNGSNYIFYFSPEQMEDMPDSLVTRLNEYEEFSDSKQDEYNQCCEDLYDAIDNKYYLETSMMPNTTPADTTKEAEIVKLTSAEIGTIPVADLTSLYETGAKKAILTIAQVMVDYRYEVTIEDGSVYDSSAHTWTGKFKVTNTSDTTDSAISPSDVTLTFVEDEKEYLQDKIDELVGAIDIEDDIDITAFKEKLKEYSLDNLDQFKTCYEECANILVEKGYANKSEAEANTEFYQLYYSYYEKAQACNDEFLIRQAEVDAAQKEVDDLTSKVKEYQEELNFENYLGETLYKEFCLYRREDTYQNDNYISDGQDNSQLLQNAQKLVEVATKELIKASLFQTVYSANLNNLFTNPIYEPFYDYFDLFNWIHAEIDGKQIMLRLIGITFDFSSIEKIEVEFSEQVRNANGITDLQSILGQAKSMATSYSSTVKQAASGQEACLEFDTIKQEGLNSALMNIKNSNNEEVVIDNCGINCRSKDQNDQYDQCQLRITGKNIVMTDDDWRTARLAIGKIFVNYDSDGDGIKEPHEEYGIVADCIIGDMIIGETLLVANSSGTFLVDKDGIIVERMKLDMSNADGSRRIVIDPELDSILSVYTNSKQVFYVDTNGNMCMLGNLYVNNNNMYLKVDMTAENIIEVGYGEITGTGNEGEAGSGEGGGVNTGNYVDTPWYRSSEGLNIIDLYDGGFSTTTNSTDVKKITHNKLIEKDGNAYFIEGYNLKKFNKQSKKWDTISTLSTYTPVCFVRTNRDDNNLYVCSAYSSNYRIHQFNLDDSTWSIVCVLHGSTTNYTNYLHDVFIDETMVHLFGISTDFSNKYYTLGTEDSRGALAWTGVDPNNTYIHRVVPYNDELYAIYINGSVSSFGKITDLKTRTIKFISALDSNCNSSYNNNQYCYTLMNDKLYIFRSFVTNGNKYYIYDFKSEQISEAIDAPPLECYYSYYYNFHSGVCAFNDGENIHLYNGILTNQYISNNEYGYTDNGYIAHYIYDNNNKTLVNRNFNELEFGKNFRISSQNDYIVIDDVIYEVESYYTYYRNNTRRYNTYIRKLDTSSPNNDWEIIYTFTTSNDTVIRPIQSNSKDKIYFVTGYSSNLWYYELNTKKMIDYYSGKATDDADFTTGSSLVSSEAFGFLDETTMTYYTNKQKLTKIDIITNTSESSNSTHANALSNQIFIDRYFYFVGVDGYLKLFRTSIDDGSTKTLCILEQNSITTDKGFSMFYYNNKIQIFYSYNGVLSKTRYVYNITNGTLEILSDVFEDLGFYNVDEAGGYQTCFLPMIPTSTGVHIFTGYPFFTQYVTNGGYKHYLYTEGGFTPIEPDDPDNPSTGDVDNPSDKIFYITNDGDGYFYGTVYAKDGKFSGDIYARNLTLGENAVVSGKITSQTGEIGKWIIAENGLISPDFGEYTTGISGLALYSDGNILNRGLWNGQDNAWYAYLYKGKWVFGLGNYFGATTDEQYSDISANGIYMCSKHTILNKSSQYLFAVDTTNDTVSITNSSSNSPALTITNNYFSDDNSYDAPALVLHSPKQGYRNRPLDVRMRVTGEILGTGQSVDNEYCMQMFGEQEYGRIIFRSSKIVGTVNDDGTVTYAPEGNTADTESSDPLVPSMIGSSTFRWFQGYFMELYSTNGLNTSSDKKIKNHIQDIDANKSLELINSLTPVEYTLKNNANNRKHMGFYAQDVKKACDDMELGNMSLYAATWHKDGQEQECYYSEDAPDEELQWTLKYEEFIAPLVGAVQALTKRVDDLEADNEKLRTRIEKLEDASE